MVDAINLGKHNQSQHIQETRTLIAVADAIKPRENRKHSISALEKKIAVVSDYESDSHDLSAYRL